MSDAKYSHAVTQLKIQVVLNNDAQMFVQDDFYQAEPDVVAAIMAQLSLKAGLEEWGDKAFTVAQSEIKQLHFRNTFKPKHWREMIQVQRHTVLESHIFLSRNGMERSRGETWLVAISIATASPKRMLACRQSLRNKYCCRASLTPRKKGMSQYWISQMRLCRHVLRKRRVWRSSRSEAS
jgi:hypothetical protein